MATVESLRTYQINILDYSKIKQIEKELNNNGIASNNIECYGIMVNMQDSDFSYKEKTIKVIEKYINKSQAKMVLDGIPELLIIR